MTRKEARKCEKDSGGGENQDFRESWKLDVFPGESSRNRGLFMFGQIRFLSNTHFLSQGIWHQMKELFREPHFSRNIHYRKNNFVRDILNGKPDLKPFLSF